MFCKLVVDTIKNHPKIVEAEYLEKNPHILRATTSIILCNNEYIELFFTYRPNCFDIHSPNDKFKEPLIVSEFGNTAEQLIYMGIHMKSHIIGQIKNVIKPYYCTYLHGDITYTCNNLQDINHAINRIPGACKAIANKFQYLSRLKKEN